VPPEFAHGLFPVDSADSCGQLTHAVGCMDGACRVHDGCMSKLGCQKQLEL
jgi:hypothetical protein